MLIYIHVDSFQKLLIKPARHRPRLHRYSIIVMRCETRSCTHAAHTNLAFILTLTQGGNICNTLFDTYFLAVEVASLPINCKFAASYDFLRESRLLLDKNFLAPAPQDGAPRLSTPVRLTADPLYVYNMIPYMYII